MGMDYHLECLDCKIRSKDVEFSVVGYLSLKRPDDAADGLIGWTKLLVKHSGHRIALVDSIGNQTDPSKLSGKYVLGLSDVPHRKT